MKKLFKYIPFALFSLAMSSLIFSCDDKEFDFNGNNGAVFLSTPTSTMVNSKANTFYGSFEKTPIGVFGEMNIKFPVRSTVPVGNQVEVILESEAGLVENYNLTHKTSYLMAPDNLFVLKNNKLTIKSGQYLSDDSIEVAIDKDKLVDLEAKEFLLPISITSLKGNLAISENKKTIFLAIKISENNIWNDATKNNIQGTLVVDRSNFTASTSAPLKVQNGSFKDIFDGNKYSTWTMSSVKEIPFIVDLGKDYEVTGINSNYYGWNPVIQANQKIYSSLDNSKWDLIGTTSKSNQDVIFYKAINMRYIKWTAPVISVWGGQEASLNISEFNVYTK